MDLDTLYARTVASWTDRVRSVAPAHWDRPTPCRDWSVRELTNHVVGEDLWTAPLLEGQTIADVGGRFDGDVLGADPVARASAAAEEASASVRSLLPTGGHVHLSYGDESMEEYVHQLAADHLVHSWDLAVSIGADPRLDLDLVAEVAAWFDAREDVYRSGGVVAPRLGLNGEPQHDLLARFGRDAAWGPNHAAVAGLSDAFGRRDVDAIMALMTPDCLFEATGPAPDGVRHEGADAVRRVWEELFAETRDATFAEEELFVGGDRGVLRWRFSWTGDDGAPGHVRGVDVLRLRDGLVAEKLSYVKG